MPVHVGRIVLLVSALLVATKLPAAEPTPSAVVVLARDAAIEIDHALVDTDQLWVPADKVEAITGFVLKPEGLCNADLCIPIPKGADWTASYDDATYFNVSAFAQHVDQAVAAELDDYAWSFTAVPSPNTAPLSVGQAPDFALPDRAGKIVHLSDFRGKKVLLWTWASWCTCRFDLAGWQKVYDDLKSQNFEIVAVAEDTGGSAVATPWYDKAKVTYTALVDTQHTVSSLYQMVNVPSGVWIDEKGQIVRPAEVAYSKQQKVLGQLIGDDRYAAGVRDWVARGPQSPFVLSPEKLKPRLAHRDSKLRLAEAHFKLGAYFSTHEKPELAARHWQAAQELAPDNWNYHRQQWSFDKKKEMSNFMAKVRKLGDRPYYDPVEFPADAPALPPAK